MNLTKYILSLLMILLISCDEEVNRLLYNDSEMGQYVRFALLLDNNGSPIEVSSFMGDVEIPGGKGKTIDTGTHFH